MTCRNCKSAVRRIVPGAGTSIYDAVVLGSNSLKRRPEERRRAIVLVTDGGETTSYSKFDEAAARRLPQGRCSIRSSSVR